VNVPNLQQAKIELDLERLNVHQKLVDYTYARGIANPLDRKAALAMASSNLKEARASLADARREIISEVEKYLSESNKDV
jgi:hypothetical protein